MSRIEKVGMVATEKKKSSSKSKETKPETESSEIEEAVLIDDQAVEATAEDETVAEETSTDDATDSDSETEPSQEGVVVAPVPARVEPDSSGSVFWPMLLGGAIAAVLGFLASELDFFASDDGELLRLRSALTSQQERIATLEQAEPPSFDALEEKIDARLGEISESLSNTQERLTALENRPVLTGDSEVDTQAYENQLNALQQSVEKQRSEIEGLLENARSVEQATAQAAKVASAQAALSRIISAIDDGQAFSGPLEELQTSGADIPAALTENASGVATMAELQNAFPDISRRAISAARANAPAEEGGQGLGGFLKRQLGARSVQPREGSDADAVLSRAEAALRGGDLEKTLAEIAALPEAAQAAVADWQAKAQARQATKTAASDLSQSLAAN